MHVLLEVSPLSVGGPQSWVCDIAPALKQRGVAVSVISFDLTVPDETILCGRLRNDGIAARQIHLTGTWLEKLRAIESGMRGVGVCEVAHFNSDVLSGLFVPFAKRLGIPVRIIHARTPNWACRSRGLKNRVLSLLFRWQVRRSCTHAFGVTCEALAAAVGAEGGRGISREVVPSAIRSARFSDHMARHASVRRDAGAKGLTLGFVGRLTASKNPHYLVEVAVLLRKQGVNANLVFMGAGPEENVVRDRVTETGIREYVTFLPPGDNVGEVLTERMDVLMLPSDFEGTPRVAVEAQACGVPVICSTAVTADVSVVPELFHRVGLRDGYGAWAEKALQVCTIRVSREHVEACFARSPYEIENQADWLIGRYRQYLGVAG